MTAIDYTVTIRLSEEMARAVEEIREEQGGTTDELVQRALEHYIGTRTIEDLFDYGLRKSESQGLTSEDVERLVDEYRTEAG